MNEGLVFKVGADITDFTASISDVEKELKSLKETLKTATGQAIVDTNVKIKTLEDSLKNLKTSGLNGIKKPATDGAYALTSLGQVARDLPFGFIAIQNNLPQVFDSFGALTKQAGGTIPALKALGASLAGPAGISFAFGAVIAGTTALIQKYGSLGEAFNVILGITKELTAGQKAYNKALYDAAGGAAAEEAKVSILTKTLLNNKKPQDERIAAYGELKKVAPDVVAGIKDENALTAESNLLIQANASARKESVRLKVQEAGINAALTTNETKLAELRQKLTQADQEYVKASANLSKANQQQVITGFASQTQQQSALKDFNNSISVVKELRNQINTIVKEQDSYLSQLDPITIGIAKINEATRKRIEDLKKQGKAESDALKIANDEAKNYFFELQRVNGFISKDEKLTYQQRLTNLQNYANTILNVKNSESERRKALEQANKENNNFFESFKIGVTSLDVFKNALNSQAAVLQENIINQEAYNNSVKSLIPTFDLLAMRQEERNKQLKEQKALLTEFKAPTITAPQGLPTNLLSDDIIKATKEQQDAINKNISNYQAAYNIINDTFFNPLQDLFSNFLSTGKLAFADFGKAVLKAIQQIVAKILATGVIALIGTLLTGGFGAGAGGFAGGIAKVGELIAGSLGFGGKVAAPSFAGVGGGTLGMSGSVNVVLRGSDLVGSINRTNATISRVG